MSVDPSRYHIFVSPYLGTGQLLGKKIISPPGGLKPPTFRLTAERASRLRHGGSCQLFLDVTFLKINMDNLRKQNTCVQYIPSYATYLSKIKIIFDLFLSNF